MTSFPQCHRQYSKLKAILTCTIQDTYKSAFTLDDFSKMNRGFNKELMALLGNYTTGQLLFENAYECNSAGFYGQPANVSVSVNGVNTACVSQLKVLTWDMTCHPSSSNNCEFLEQAKQQTFGLTQQHPGIVGSYTSVPNGYLGPGITRTVPVLRRT